MEYYYKDKKVTNHPIIKTKIKFNKITVGAMEQNQLFKYEVGA